MTTDTEIDNVFAYNAYIQNYSNDSGGKIDF